ncbi:MAG: hypothetical protein ACOX2F_07695 [bacterium]
MIKINSVFHLVLNGRSLRINSQSGLSAKNNAVVFTKIVKLSKYIGENTRVIPLNIARAMNLKKYIALSEKTAVNAGSFSIKIEDVSSDQLKYNISINNSLYFLTFTPETLKLGADHFSILVPADSSYFTTSELADIKTFIKQSKIKSVFASGDMSQNFAKLFKKEKINIVNEVVQQDMFSNFTDD